MLARRAVPLAILAAAALAATAPGAARAATECPLGATCATLTVPLDHTGGTPGTIPIAYSKLAATGAARKGTIVLLSGGPGQSAIPLTEPFGELLEKLRGSYDLVFVDQRGTGDSGAVECDGIDTRAEVAGCAAKLGVKRAFFNTTETARDLEDLRVALGVDKLTPLGVSYGTKVAAEYARRYPQHTAALVLDSPAPVDGLDGTAVLPVLGAARVLREVCSPGPCVRSVPDVSAALVAAVHRLPVKGPLVGSRGQVRTITVDEDTLWTAIAASDAIPFLRSALPAAIASLAHGDAAPLLHALTIGSAVSGGSEGDDVNAARFLATACIESRLPWAPDSPVAGRQAALDAYLTLQGPAPFAPFKPATVVGHSPASVCKDWPPTPAPEGVPAAGPDVPVLVLSGREDLRTPLEDARRTAGQYPHATLLAVPGVGHSVLGTDASGCALDGLRTFLAGRPVEHCAPAPLSRGEAEVLGAAAYLPANLATLEPTEFKGRIGRTLTAVSDTLLGLSRDLIASFTQALTFRAINLPGVRSGYSRLTAKGWVLHRVEWVRGVQISGTVSVKGKADRFVIGGPAAAAGVLEISGKDDSRLVGTLAGRRINVRLQ
jgi:pimeloyl-ACP methyl ester carboxylesterase